MYIPWPLFFIFVSLLPMSALSQGKDSNKSNNSPQYKNEDMSFVKKLRAIDASCKYKRRTVYEDLKGLPTEAMKVPVGDQNGAGDCYAFAPSVTLEIHNRLNGAKPGCERMHWAWGAAKSRSYHSPEIQEALRRNNAARGPGGLSRLVFQAALEKGYCPSSNVAKAFSRYRKELGMSEAEVIAFFYRLNYYSKLDDKEDKELDLKGFIKKSINYINPDYSEIVKRAYGELPGKGNLVCSDQVIKIAEELKYSYIGPILLQSAWDKLEGDMDSACEDSKRCRIVPTKGSKSEPVMVNKKYISSNKGKEKIDNIITQNFCDQAIPKPITLNYCHFMLVKTTDRRVGYNKKGKFLLEGNKKCGGHAAVITGYREDPKSGEKQVLLRQSYGASYNSKGVSCECRSDKGTIAPCSDIKGAPSLKNENIGCWYPLIRIMETAKALTYVE